MWKMLSALPSPSLLEEFQLKFIIEFRFIISDSSVDEYLSKLGFFESPNCLDKFRSMFPNLKLIKIILSLYKPQKTDVFFESLRRVKGLRLERVGRDRYCKTCHIPLIQTRHMSFYPRDLYVIACPDLSVAAFRRRPRYEEIFGEWCTANWQKSGRVLCKYANRRASTKDIGRLYACREHPVIITCMSLQG